MRGHDVEEDDDGSTDDSGGGAAAKSVGLATQHHHELDGFFSQRGACFFNTDVLLAQHAARATKLDISNSLIACFWCYRRATMHVHQADPMPNSIQDLKREFILVFPKTLLKLLFGMIQKQIISRL